MEPFDSIITISFWKSNFFSYNHKLKKHFICSKMFWFDLIVFTNYTYKKRVNNKKIGTDYE